MDEHVQKNIFRIYHNIYPLYFIKIRHKYTYFYNIWVWVLRYSYTILGYETSYGRIRKGYNCPHEN